MRRRKAKETCVERGKDVEEKKRLGRKKNVAKGRNRKERETEREES